MIDVVTTNDINDQNQLYSMAKNASELLEIDNPTVIADTDEKQVSDSHKASCWLMDERAGRRGETNGES